MTTIIGFFLLLGVLAIPAALLAGDTPLMMDCSKLARW